MAADPVAAGAFTVPITPEEGRVRVTSISSGGLTGASTGTMRTEVTPGQGSAAHVLIDRARGTLAGRRGRFVLAHPGLMDRGAQDLRIAIVPGTGALAGVRSPMTPDRSGGGHAHALHCSLPED